MAKKKDDGNGEEKAAARKEEWQKNRADMATLMRRATGLHMTKRSEQGAKRDDILKAALELYCETLAGE